MNISFYKEADRWYADMPSVSKEDCEMVQGADLLLDRLSLGYDKVEVDFSDVDNGKPIYKYHLIEHDNDGGTYTNGKETFWLCNVTHDVFGEHPKMLYINKNNDMRTFNVLIFKNGKVEHYDVLPYFRNSWKEKYNKEEKDKIKAAKYKAKRIQLFKDWVIGRSKYMFWSRCEYETLLASWPFGSYRLKNDMKEFLKDPVNLDDYTQCLKFENIIIADMEKIDVHEQIMMNINTIVDILYTELKIDKYDLGK